MKNFKRFLAMAAIVIIAICAILTLVFALLTYFGVGDFSAAWKASAWCMVVFPVLIYAMLFIYRLVDKRDN